MKNPVLMLVTALLAASAVAGPTTMRVGLAGCDYASFNGRAMAVYFENDRPRVSVEIYVATRATTPAFDGNWASDVKFALTQHGQPVDAKATLIDSQPEWLTQRKDLDPYSPVFHTVTAKYEMRALVAGEYHLQIRYGDDVQDGTFIVAKGDENAAIADLNIQRELARGATSWNDYKRLQLRRIELSPTNMTALWQLANEAELRAPLAETRSYYERLRDLYRASEAREVNALAPTIDRIIDLLPEYYSDRANLRIEKDCGPGRPQTVKLVRTNSAPKN